MPKIRDRVFYEKLYDKGTVEQCRSGEEFVNKAFSDMEKKTPHQVKQKPLAVYIPYSQMYFKLVESIAGDQFLRRQETIDKWIKDEIEQANKLETSQPSRRQYCRYCGKDMNLVRKDYMTRKKPNSNEYSEDILFMFECRSCNKREAYWEDGTEWERTKVHCEKCNGLMDEKETENKPKVFATTYTCSECGHEYSDTLDLSHEKTEEKEDPFFELDLKRFCLDSEMVDKLITKGNHLTQLFNLHFKQIDKNEDSNIDNLVSNIKKLKFAQLIESLNPVIEKAGFNEFKLGEPEIDKEITVSFSCLDAKPEREEDASKTDLKKLIQKTLGDTNWRLMSEGISYRLGYLSGRLRAYEKEEEIRRLVDQQFKSNSKKNEAHQPEFEYRDVSDFKGFDLRDSAVIYFQNITHGSETIEDGEPFPDTVSTMTAELNPNLRVVIPLRKGDSSVPKFVRDFDFTIVSKTTHQDNRRIKRRERLKNESGKEKVKGKKKPLK